MGIRVLNDFESLRVEKARVFSYPAHAHTYYEMLLYFPFDGKIYVNGTALSVEAPTAVLITPYDIHSITVEGCEDEYIKVQFGEDIVKMLNKEINQAYVLKNTGTFFAEMMKEAYSESRANDYEKMLICTLCECILEKGEIISNSALSKVHTLTVNAIRYINNHFDDNASLSGAAEALCVSPQYLSKVFKLETGRGFVDYLCKTRLEYAAELIKNSRCDITEACFASGYGNLSHFLRSFKRYYGVTPKQYKKIH